MVIQQVSGPFLRLRSIRANFLRKFFCWFFPTEVQLNFQDTLRRSIQSQLTTCTRCAAGLPSVHKQLSNPVNNLKCSRDLQWTLVIGYVKPGKTGMAWFWVTRRKKINKTDVTIRLPGMDRSWNLFFVKSWALNRFIYSFRFFCRLIPSKYLKRYVIKFMSQLLSAVSLAARSSSLLLCILGCHAKFEKKPESTCERILFFCIHCSYKTLQLFWHFSAMDH